MLYLQPMKSSLLLLLLATCCMAQSLLIRGALVFDGERMLGVRDVLVESGKISSVDVSIQAPPQATIIEATGKTLLPGLFDSHVHLGNENISLRIEALFGVTTAIDLFNAGATPRQMHERARKAPAGELADFLTA